MYFKFFFFEIQGHTYLSNACRGVLPDYLLVLENWNVCLCQQMKIIGFGNNRTPCYVIVLNKNSLRAFYIPTFSQAAEFCQRKLNQCLDKADWSVHHDITNELDNQMVTAFLSTDLELYY